MAKSIKTPSDQYPDKLTDKDLREELDQFIKSLKDHDPENGLIDTLNYYQALVQAGYLELQKRESARSSRWSIALGLVTTLAAFVSIWLSIQATKLSKDSNAMSDKSQIELIKLEHDQAELLNVTTIELRKIRSTVDSLIRSRLNVEKKKRKQSSR